MALPLDLTLQINQTERRRALANALMSQALKPIQNQSAGGYVVPTSPFQGLAKIAQAYVASRMGNNIDQQEQNLAKGYEQKQQNALSKFASNFGGQTGPAATTAPATGDSQSAVQTYPLSSAPKSAPLTVTGTGGTETMASEPPAAPTSAAPGPLSPTTATTSNRNRIVSALTPQQRAYNAELQYIKDSGDTSLIPGFVKAITAPPTLHSLAAGATLYDNFGNVIAKAPSVPVRVDLGDRIGLLDPATQKIVGSIPKGVSPSARYFENGAISRESARQNAEDARLARREQFRLQHPTASTRPNFSAQHFNAQIDSANTYIRTHPEPKDPFDPARMFWLRQQALANTPKVGTSAVPAASAPSSPTSASPQAAGNDVLDQARDAIAKGAPRAEVEQRLKQMGIDPSGL